LLIQGLVCVVGQVGEQIFTEEKQNGAVENEKSTRASRKQNDKHGNQTQTIN
jgi:hypothetical protein